MSVTPNHKELGTLSTDFMKASKGPKDEVVAKPSPAFGECCPPMGFTHHKAQGKHYHVTGTYADHEVY